MPFRKERDRLKDIDSELSRIKKGDEKPVKEKPVPKKVKAKLPSKLNAQKKKHKAKKR
jgi:hypothetical protein